MNAQINELQVLEQNSNAIVEAFKTEGGAKTLFDRIAEQARSVVPDLSTDKGRKAIASMARKVASTKTAFDAHGKELKEQYTVITNKIDADRKLFRDACDALRDEIRKPLTDWEQAEKDRVAKHQNAIQEIKDAALDTNDVESGALKNRIAWVDQWSIDASFEDFEQEAKLAKFETLEKLRTALDAREKYEAEQAELERLRKEQLEREQRERDERIAKEAADKARIEAEAKALAEQRRVEREKQEAEEKAEREKREAAEREARLIAEKEEAELRAQQAAVMERQRIEREQAAKEEAERKAEEARLANVEHMRSINNEILNKLCEIGLDEGQAKAVITAIARNQIPNVSIKY
ncbi:hypothetical protein [Acinetobacter haemolyticus]|uniref:hypothetical protein n=1 Tax=Acinetobacter haemolyticus TaxID=29430 RepID=UPI001372CF34|nr:hypothetical protein [Acinetobacter haemolyticus]NAR86442.1 hypothetical protein [Acinetobacter haemolyticus]